MEPITDNEADKIEAAAELETPPRLLEREPVLVIVLGAGLIPAVLALLTSFGVHLSADQVSAILGVAGVVATIAAALAARARAFAPSTVAKLLEVPRADLNAIAAGAAPRAPRRRRRPRGPAVPPN